MFDDYLNNGSAFEKKGIESGLATHLEKKQIILPELIEASGNKFWVKKFSIKESDESLSRYVKSVFIKHPEIDSVLTIQEIEPLEDSERIDGQRMPTYRYSIYSKDGLADMCGNGARAVGLYLNEMYGVNDSTLVARNGAKVDVVLNNGVKTNFDKPKEIQDIPDFLNSLSEKILAKFEKVTKGLDQDDDIQTEIIRIGSLQGEFDYKDFFIKQIHELNKSQLNSMFVSFVNSLKFVGIYDVSGEHDLQIKIENFKELRLNISLINKFLKITSLIIKSSIRSQYPESVDIMFFYEEGEKTFLLPSERGVYKGKEYDQTGSCGTGSIANYLATGALDKKEVVQRSGDSNWVEKFGDKIVLTGPVNHVETELDNSIIDRNLDENRLKLASIAYNAAFKNTGYNFNGAEQTTTPHKEIVKNETREVVESLFEKLSDATTLHNILSKWSFYKESVPSFQKRLDVLAPKIDFTRIDYTPDSDIGKACEFDQDSAGHGIIFANMEAHGESQSINPILKFVKEKFPNQVSFIQRRADIRMGNFGSDLKQFGDLANLDYQIIAIEDLRLNKEGELVDANGEILRTVYRAFTWSTGKPTEYDELLLSAWESRKVDVYPSMPVSLDKTFMSVFWDPEMESVLLEEGFDVLKIREFIPETRILTSLSDEQIEEILTDKDNWVLKATPFETLLDENGKPVASFGDHECSLGVTIGPRANRRDWAKLITTYRKYNVPSIVQKFYPPKKEKVAYTRPSSQTEIAEVLLIHRIFYTSADGFKRGLFMGMPSQAYGETGGKVHGNVKAVGGLAEVEEL